MGVESKFQTDITVLCSKKIKDREGNDWYCHLFHQSRTPNEENPLKNPFSITSGFRVALTPYPQLNLEDSQTSFVRFTYLTRESAIREAYNPVNSREDFARVANS